MKLMRFSVRCETLKIGMGNSLHHITPAVMFESSRTPLWTFFYVVQAKPSPLLSFETPSFKQSVESLKKVSVVLSDTLIATNNQHLFLVCDQLSELKELQA